MIAANPLYMVGAYKLNTDSYRINAARRTPGGQQAASRQALNLPFLQSAYYQSARTEASGLSSLLSSALSVKQSAQALLGESGLTALNQRVAVSSKPDKLKAEAKSGSAFQSFRVKINAVASEQQNGGISSAKASASPVQAGWNEFSLKQNGETSSIKVYLGAGQTYEQALGKIKAGINQQAVGVKAAIVDDAGGKSHLKVTSDQTGTKQAFTLLDVSGNAVTALGLNNTERSASNAAYSVNGGYTQSSETNEIVLDNGAMKLTLLKTDSQDITVTTTADSQAIAKPVKQLVDAYNQFQHQLQKAPGYLNRSLAKSLEHAAKPSILEQLDITEKADGTLVFDETKFKQQVAESYSNVKRSLIGIGGLASSLAHSFSRLEQMPSQALFSMNGSSLNPYRQYQAPIKTYLPLPLSGLLLDQVM